MRGMTIWEEHDMKKVPAVDEGAGVLDELQAFYLAKAEQDGWVYTSVLRQLVNRMYRERDYLERRKAQGLHTAYDYPRLAAWYPAGRSSAPVRGVDRGHHGALLRCNRK
jgi:hypothetical protein